MSSADWGLRLRMLTSLALLAVCTLAFLACVWLVLTVLSLFFVGVAAAPLVGAVCTLVLVALIAYAEYDRGGTVEGRADATPIEPEDDPELHALVTNVAANMDVPVPDIAVSERETPEAMVVGLRPSSTSLVLSMGTFRALDREEVEAVVAHELAHVASRDAMVMTLVSIPAMVADGLRSRLLSLLTPSSSSSSDGSTGRSRRSGFRFRLPRSKSGARSTVIAILVVICLKLFLITVATLTWIASRTIVAVLSRARETAADRTAAEVTGSPDALASALYELDGRIDDAPRQDLREASSVSALSILPLEPQTVEPTMLGAAGDQQPFLWSVRKPIRRAKRRLFRTHPDTERRIDRLQDVAQDLE